MSWNASQYLAFDEPRLRPAVDLLGRVGAEAPNRVVDLGCGPGNVTGMLAARWPGAGIVGVDSSPEMLAAAAAVPGVEWVQADIADWEPAAPPDVVFSNAALHWLDGHDALFPRLFRWLAPGGWLAVQMPHNHHAPTHQLLFEVARASPWGDRLSPLLRPAPVLDAGRYHDLLAQPARELDIWETTYLHVLEGPDPVLEWTKGSVLRPLLEELTPPEREEFLSEYRDRLRAAYPAGPDGRTRLAFRRLFIVARAG